MFVNFKTATTFSEMRMSTCLKMKSALQLRCMSSKRLRTKPSMDTKGIVTEVDGPEFENCASNWKGSASLEKKRMCGVFDETGILLAPALIILCCG